MTFIIEVTDPKRLALMQAYADEMSAFVQASHPDIKQVPWTLQDAAYGLFCDGIRYNQFNGILKNYGK